jgi:molecular chaperone GrpE
VGKKSEQSSSDTTTESPGEVPQAEDAVTTEEGGDNKELQHQLGLAREDVQRLQEQYIRTLADMDNLRKRTQRDKEEAAKFANESILREILPVIDNLERAVEHAEQAGSTDGLLEGVRMTLTQFNQVLTRFGVATIDAVGKPFDPAFHQAMGQLESTEHPANSVMVEMQKGYQLNDRLLRPAFVLLAKAPAESADNTNENNEKDDDA